MRKIFGIETNGQTFQELAKPCLRCGMIANSDPWEHKMRYRHEPVILREGLAYEHNGRGQFNVRVDS